ncbi:inorganic diphosphatase [Candidatus Woesearchaeota archaeon]|nr:inorganic diphosphatase [Nanoarchaeota archaeon]MCB9370964.1 inorganic diphosphatase [Candidatus Woesearchaeota archaeon]USN44066.1 MAG: inorganic diphosphatase [Candidatus Woesearchaeota archaeon]
MANLWHDVDRKKADEFNVIIENPTGSRVKYEVDKETGLICFDRVLYSPMHYPCDYGFIPQTLWEDGDPIDVLVMTHEPLVPSCLIKCRPLGVLDMIDGGEGDAKVLAVPVKDPRFENLKELSDVEPHILKEIKHFFTVYKDLENKKVEIGEWRDKAEAVKDIEKSFGLYDSKYKKV